MNLDRLDESQLKDPRRELAGMSDAALGPIRPIEWLAASERIDIPRMATMQAFPPGMGRVPAPVGVVLPQTEIRTVQ